MISYCYRFKDINNNVIYVGKTVDINKRMAQHFGGKGHLGKDCYKSVAVIEYQKYKTESDALIYETYYITKYSPKYNKLGQSRDKPTVQLDEKEWKTYQVLKKQVEKSPASWGCLTYILIIALIYAIFQLIG